MRCLRRYFVPALLLIPLIFLCGKLLLTPVTVEQEIRMARDFFGLISYSNATSRPDTQRGWPWVFQHSIDISGLRSLDPEFESRSFSLLLLLADLVVLTTFIAVAIYVALRHHRRRGAWLRFSIREMLAAVAVVGIAAAWLARTYAEWRHEQQLFPLYAQLEPHGGQGEYVGPDWLRRLWHEDDLTMFRRVVSICPDTESWREQIASDPEEWETRWHISDESIDKAQVVVSHLPHVRHITVYNGSGQRLVHQTPSWDDFALQGINAREGSGLGQIEGAYFGLTELGRRATYLIQQLSGLKSVEFEYCDFQDEILASIGQLRTLEEVRIFDCKFDDAALAKLGSLAGLQRLTLYGTDVSDASIETLVGFSSLQELWLGPCAMTDAGLRRLVEVPSLKHLVLQESAISSDTIQFLKQRINTVVYAEPPSSKYELKNY